MNSLLAAKDQILHYAAQHRLLAYVALAVAIFLIIALIRFASARPAAEVSLSSALRSPGNAVVTPINEAAVARCTHCGVNISARQDFCPSCGYAQPMQQTGTARSRN